MISTAQITLAPLEDALPNTLTISTSVRYIRPRHRRIGSRVMKTGHTARAQRRVE
jgi:hypothetical protein